MTGKNIFVYKLLKCCEILRILVYFLCKNCNPLKKVTPPSLSPVALFKNWDPVKPPFLKIWSEAQPPSLQKGRGCTQWTFTRSNRSNWNGNLVTATGNSWQISFEVENLEKFGKLIVAIWINRSKSNMNLLESNVWNIL